MKEYYYSPTAGSYRKVELRSRNVYDFPRHTLGGIVFEVLTWGGLIAIILGIAYVVMNGLPF